jgi:ABC-2 type transport system ATP-binding protein
MVIEHLEDAKLAPDIVIDPEKDAVEIVGVSKIFKKSKPLLRWRRQKQGSERREVRAVDNVTLTIHRREIVGILGANGSGKSTLVRMLSTLLIPDTGSVRIFGYDVEKDERMVQRLINRVSVEASFFKKLSPMENLIYAARLYNMPGAQARSRIRAILGRLGIPKDRIGQPLEHMSRGMQQKVAIAHRAAAGRANHRAGPALEDRGAELCARTARDARCDYPDNHARHGRGGGAV